MRKTTVYMPDELKLALEGAAAAAGRSEADLIRDGVRLIALQHSEPPPTLPLFESGDPTLAERVDEELTGFGDG